MTHARRILDLALFLLLALVSCTSHVTQDDVESLPPAALGTGDVLLVAASTTLGTGDTAVKNRLVGLGYTVSVRAAASSVSGDATGKVLVAISSTVASADVAAKFRTVTVPALVWENAVLDDMGMVSTTTGNFGTTATQTSLVIANSTDPMAAGLSGTIVASTASGAFTWGKPNANATTIATVPGDTTQAAIFRYASGAVMPGLTAPARRVGFFLGDTTAATLTADGWKLFDAAVAWATNQSTSPSVTVTATDSDAAEPNNPGVFTITRTGATTSALAVSYGVSGTASSGSDYTALGASVTIPAGAASATVTVSPVDDTASESTETVILTLSAGSGYVVGSPSSATVNLTDNDGAALPQVLFVVGNATLGAGDSAVQNRIAGLGYSVVVKAATAAMTADATGKALVVVSSTVASTDVGSKFRTVKVPVVAWENGILDDMGMTSTAAGAFGTTAGTSVVISAPNHPLAAGLTGTVTVVTSSDPLTWGQPNGNAFKVATLAGSSTNAPIFAYEPGASMPGLVAPARRVGFFLGDLGATKVTAAGWSLFDAAVKWAAAPFPAALTTERALILVDERLSSKLGTRLSDYRTLAAQKRGFGIALHVISGIDEWRYDFVKSYIQTQRAGDASLEGVLLVGNIRLPSFFQSRTDTHNVRYLPRYLEDLDGVFTKRLTDGSILANCPVPWVDTYNCYQPMVGDPSTLNVPPHDFDYLTKGPAPDPEIWTSYMPVGGVGSDTYDDFASQLNPYLDKVLRYYRGQLVGNKKFYFVTANLGEEPVHIWNAFPKANIDLYGKPGPNGEKDAACITPEGVNLCYTRWPTESYPDATSWINAVLAGEMGLGDWSWINYPDILIGHMNSTVYDAVEIDMHSNETVSIASTDQVKTMTKAGLLVTMDGCAVAGYRQPRTTSPTDAAVLVNGNVMMAYLYGNSQAISASGDPFWRGHYAKHANMYDYMKNTAGAYLGRAHLDRNKQQFARSTSDGELREFGMEMLAGDPFMNF
jgi:hypothetical protein